MGRGTEDEGCDTGACRGCADYMAVVRSDYLSVDPTEGRYCGAPGKVLRGQAGKDYGSSGTGYFGSGRPSVDTAGRSGSADAASDARSGSGRGRQCGRTSCARGLSVFRIAVLSESAALFEC